MIKKKEKEGSLNSIEDDSEDNAKALTIVHMQGPLYLLIIGLSFASLTFFIELLIYRCCLNHENKHRD